MTCGSKLSSEESKESGGGNGSSSKELVVGSSHFAFLMEGPHFAGIIGVGGGGRGVADMLVLVVSSPVFLEGFEEVEAFFFKDTAAFSALTG